MENDLPIGVARTLGKVGTEIHAGRMDLATAVDYMVHNVEMDADDLDIVRKRLRGYANDAPEST